MSDITDAIFLPGRVAWRKWLQKNHQTSSGAWVTITKKTSRKKGLTYEEAVLEAVCFGWIDSTVRRHDADSFYQWFSPRKPTSAWSESNKKRVELLEREGCMTEAGLRAVEEARKSGSWDKLNAVESLEIPKDLETELKKNPGAHSFFQALAPSHKKQYIYWIREAKRPETRKRRISETVRLAAEGRKTRVD